MTVITKMDADVANKSARSATDPNGPTDRSATWLTNTVLDDVRSSVHERANHLPLDRVACAPAKCPASRLSQGNGRHQQCHPADRRMSFE